VVAVDLDTKTKLVTVALQATGVAVQLVLTTMHTGTTQKTIAHLVQVVSVLGLHTVVVNMEKTAQ
jgi:Tfp pilus assembly pilus retraction ATPase PilT